MSLPNPMRILVLTSSTGGGHDMRARALRDWATRTDIEHGGHEVHIHQVLEETHPGYAFGVWLYNAIQRSMPRAHHVYFNFLEAAALHRRAGGIWGGKNFSARVAAYKPDVVVSTHAHLNHGFFALARAAAGRDRIRCITYCGELSGGYGFSRHWVNPQADGFIAATGTTLKAALDLRFPRQGACVGGFLLRPAFYQSPLDAAGRQAWVLGQLGMDPGKFLLVLSTGANGANNHLALLRALERAGIGDPPQVVALCGRNQHSLRRIEKWAAQRPGWPIRAMGPVEDMASLLQCASAVVARPGTGTTSEAIMCGCPVIFNGMGGIMPQESITLRYMSTRGTPKMIWRVADLPKILCALRTTGTLEREAAWVTSLQPRQHPVDILRTLAREPGP